MTADGPQTPTTAAGRALLGREEYNSRAFPLITPDAIVAIEQEARAAADARIRLLEEALRDAYDDLAWLLRNDGGECPADYPVGRHQALRTTLRLAALLDAPDAGMAVTNPHAPDVLAVAKTIFGAVDYNALVDAVRLAAPEPVIGYDPGLVLDPVTQHVGPLARAIVNAACVWADIDYGDPGELLATANLLDAVRAYRLARAPSAAPEAEGSAE